MPLTKEDRNWLIESQLNEARSKIEFMHGCLTEDNYEYAYPQMTIEFLAELDALIPRKHFCFHSNLKNKNECESCQETYDWHMKRAEIQSRCDHLLRVTYSSYPKPTKICSICGYVTGKSNEIQD